MGVKKRNSPTCEPNCNIHRNTILLKRFLNGNKFATSVKVEANLHLTSVDHTGDIILFIVLDHNVCISIALILIRGQSCKNILELKINLQTCPKE